MFNPIGITSKLTAQEGNASAAKIEEETVETKKSPVCRLGFLLVA